MISIKSMKLLLELFLSYLVTSTIISNNISKKDEIKTAPYSENSNEFSLDNLYYVNLYNNYDDYNNELDNDSTRYEKVNGNLVIESSTELLQKQCNKDEFNFPNKFGHITQTKNFSKIISEDLQHDGLIFMNEEFFDI